MIKGKDQSITLTGAWQALNLPKKYVALQFFNLTASTVDVGKNSASPTVYQTMQVNDSFNYTQRDVKEPYIDLIYVKGTLGETITYEIQAEEKAIDAL